MIDIGEKYIQKMMHAIGMDNKDPINGTYDAYRNCSYYNSPQEEWEWLRANKFAKCIISKDGDEYIYSLTNKGFKTVANYTGILIRYTLEFEPE